MMASEAESRRSVVFWFLLVTAVGLVVRVLYLLQARANDPLFFAPQMDALYHHQWARAIMAGMEFGQGAFFRAPLYPFFLGMLYKLFGPDLFAARLAQAVLGSVSCGLVFILARQLAGGRGTDPGSSGWVPRVSGLVMAFYPLAVYFDGELLIPALLVFLVLFGLVLFYRSRQLDRQWYLPGLVFGLSAIARPNMLAFIAVLPVWFFLEYRWKGWKRLAPFWAAAALAVVPITIRNYVASGELVPIAWQGGTNFYIGNNPESDGMTAILPGTREDWWGGFHDVKALAEQALGRELNGAEVDRYWLGRGIEFWRRQPGRALVLLARKSYLLVCGQEIANNRDVYFFKRYSFLNLLVFDAKFLQFPFGLLFPLALVGVLLGRSRWRRPAPAYLFLATYGLSFVLFFVTARFRMPMIPLFIILGVSGLAGVLRLRGGKLVLPALVFVASLLLFNAGLAGAGRKTDPAQSHFLVASALDGQDRTEAALFHIEQALSLDSATNILGLEATIRMKLGQPNRAERAALAGVRIEPDQPEPYGTLGTVYAMGGRLDTAQVCLRRCVELDPSVPAGWYNLGNIAVGRRDLVAARGFLERAVELAPGMADAHYLLGVVDLYEGNREDARSRWQQVIELEPDHPKALQALKRVQ